MGCGLVAVGLLAARCEGLQHTRTHVHLLECNMKCVLAMLAMVVVLQSEMFAPGALSANRWHRPLQYSSAGQNVWQFQTGHAV